MFDGLLLHFFECNLLDILLKKNYEKPVDSAQDVLDNNLTVIYTPGSQSYVEIMKNSPAAVYRDLTELTVVAKVIFCFIEKFPF